MSKMMYLVSICLFFVLFSNISGQTNGGGLLTIEKAIKLAIENNPDLKVLSDEIQARKAIEIQSSLLPNPEFGVETENIFGNKDFSGFNNSEISAHLSQDILLAGKIDKRVEVAESDISLAEWDYEIKRIELVTDIRKTYFKVLAAQDQIRKNKELVKISETFIKNLKKRVESGKISPTEISRARIILNSLSIELNRLELQSDTWKSELMVLTGDPDLPVQTLTGKINEPLAMPVFDTLVVQLENNPELKRFGSEFKKQNAVILLEEARAIPDLKLIAGFKRLNDVKANTYLLGASLQLPLFDRNQGAIQAAQIHLGKKYKEYTSTKNRLRNRLQILYNRFIFLKKTVSQLYGESIPEAKKTFEIIREGNLAGRFAIIDVLDAERNLFDLQNQLQSTSAEVYLVQIEIEGLIGRTFE